VVLIGKNMRFIEGKKKKFIFEVKDNRLVRRAKKSGKRVSLPG
jgi:hypothetical protein